MRFATAAALLLATTSLAPAWAADFNAASAIDQVTVFPQGADVTRVTEIDIPAGDHRILLNDLPASVDPRSIRVEGSGSGTLEIASVDTKSVYVTAADQDVRRKELEKQIAALYDERTALDQTIGDANHQRNFLLGLADKQLTPQSSTETIKGIDVVQLTSLLDLVQQRLAGLAKTVQEAQLRQRGIDEKVNELNAAIAALAPADAYRLEAAINVAAAGPMKGTLRISYRLNEAGWMPYYDARMVTPKDGGTAKLEIVRRAEVMQSTSENWTNVALTLSTTRPSGTTSAPDIYEEELYAFGKDDDLRRDKARPVAEAPAGALMMQEGDAEMTAADALTAKKEAAPEPKLVAQRQAMIEMAGFQANYVIAGRVSVDNTGSAKKVRITSDSHDAKLEVTAVPLFDPNAYLTASFKVEGEGPMLPGYVNLYRDGVFVGQGQLPLLNAKEEAKLGFGVDDMVKVERKEVKKAIGEQGLLTSSNVEERAWDISIKNLHSFKVPVRVYDRKPFTARDDVEIETLPGMTPPTEENVDKKRGVLMWMIDVEPQKDAVIQTGYKITWPEGMRIGMSQ